jgi:hypothetical protein
MAEFDLTVEQTEQAQEICRRILGGKGHEEIAALIAERDALRGALAPFAEAANQLREYIHDEGNIWKAYEVGLQAGDLRHAKRVYDGINLPPET